MLDKQIEDTWTVYMHTVPKEISGYENDKRYIGITKQTPTRRWGNGFGYKKQSFFLAIQKYGWENIKHEILTTTNNYNTALQLEYISILRTNDKKYGCIFQTT